VKGVCKVNTNCVKHCKVYDKTHAISIEEKAIMVLAVGTVAPSFSTVDDTGKEVSLADFKDKVVVLYFYPKDDTPGCTKQAQSFRDTVINERCTKAATNDFAKLAKTPPAGFIPYTCSCVVQEINAQVPVDQARATCKAQAIAKFGKP
jgi:hypothetical protein